MNLGTPYAFNDISIDYKNVCVCVCKCIVLYINYRLAGQIRLLNYQQHFRTGLQILHVVTVKDKNTKNILQAGH